MSELRDDQRVGWLCFICGEAIDGLDAEQTKDAPRPKNWAYDPSLDLIANAVAYATVQNIEANEALILAHMEGRHTVREVLLVLGQARSALQEIRAGLTDEEGFAAVPAAHEIHRAVARGLGLG